jgi:hypothetical protein
VPLVTWEHDAIGAVFGPRDLALHFLKSGPSLASVGASVSPSITRDPQGVVRGEERLKGILRAKLDDFVFFPEVGRMSREPIRPEDPPLFSDSLDVVPCLLLGIRQWPRGGRSTSTPRRASSAWRVRVASAFPVAMRELGSRRLPR